LSWVKKAAFSVADVAGVVFFDLPMDDITSD
jgi:hypothetical protein